MQTTYFKNVFETELLGADRAGRASRAGPRSGRNRHVRVRRSEELDLAVALTLARNKAGQSRGFFRKKTN